MDATDPVFGYSPAGASGFFLGLNELAEVRVLTQTFNAEYGGHGGAVIEMISKSGSNQFHGSLWELHRDASSEAVLHPKIVKKVLQTIEDSARDSPPEP